uniref:C2H2-type domain-containing protein n=1 Tax=Syphacia muris TaxID=451379 RepID=A0A0N5AMN3_9BILA
MDSDNLSHQNRSEEPSLIESEFTCLERVDEKQREMIKEMLEREEACMGEADMLLNMRLLQKLKDSCFRSRLNEDNNCFVVENDGQLLQMDPLPEANEISLVRRQPASAASSCTDWAQSSLSSAFSSGMASPAKNPSVDMRNLSEHIVRWMRNIQAAEKLASVGNTEDVPMFNIDCEQDRSFDKILNYTKQLAKQICEAAVIMSSNMPSTSNGTYCAIDVFCCAFCEEVMQKFQTELQHNCNQTHSEALTKYCSTGRKKKIKDLQQKSKTKQAVLQNTIKKKYDHCRPKRKIKKIEKQKLKKQLKVTTKGKHIEEKPTKTPSKEYETQPKPNHEKASPEYTTRITNIIATKGDKDKNNKHKNPNKKQKTDIPELHHLHIRTEAEKHSEIQNIGSQRKNQQQISHLQDKKFIHIDLKQTASESSIEKELAGKQAPHRHANPSGIADDATLSSTTSSADSLFSPTETEPVQYPEMAAPIHQAYFGEPMQETISVVGSAKDCSVIAPIQEAVKQEVADCPTTPAKDIKIPEGKPELRHDMASTLQRSKGRNEVDQTETELTETELKHIAFIEKMAAKS